MTMFDKLEDKIEFEFKCMCSIYSLASFEECLSRAYEIAAKIALYRRIQFELEHGNMPEMLKQKMLHKQNLIDYLYLKGETNKIITISGGDISENTWKRILRYTDL